MSSILKLQKTLNSFEGIYVTNPVNVLYLTNFFDFTDKLGRLLITKNKSFLLFDEREEGQLKNINKEVRAVVSSKFKDEIKRILESKKITKINIEAQSLTVAELDFLKNLKSGINIKNTNNLVENFRTIKNKDEIKNIRKAVKLTEKTFEFVRKKIKIGFTEKEIAYIIQNFIRKNGGELAFDPIVASGLNSANIHHKPTNKKIKKGEPLMLDFGAKINNYCSDLTRTLFIKEINPYFKNIYEIVLSAQAMAIKVLKKGERNSKKVDLISRDFIGKSGYKENFPHSLGHSFGLEIHENPRLSPQSESILGAGTVVTIEPGIYIKGRGGVRIEDDILIKEKGIEVLTKSSKELKCMII